MTRVGVLIIGAGFAGIGLGAMLRRNGHRDFLVLEREADLGGTWRDNTYPGIACDVPSHVYSYSFRPSHEWSRLFAPGDEIHRYLRWVSDEEGVSEHIRFGVDVQSMNWDEAEQLWRCSSPAGDFEAAVLILASGRLSEPLIPELPGIDTFADGDPDRVLMHSARWRDDITLAGKRIAVVGSGASAVQLVPELAPIAAELTVMQRSAPYIVPKQDRAYSAAERAMFARVPESITRTREDWFWQQERVFAQRALIETEVESARRLALDHLRAEVPDEDLRERLTPRYEIGCKRVLLSDGYYPAMMRENVTLVDAPLASVEPGALVALDGTRVEVDVAVFATGFQSARQPYAEYVRGEGGVALAEEWAEGMHGYASIAVPGFPNMFVMNGPNAGLGHNSAIAMLETQIEYIVQALSYLLSLDGGALVVSRDRSDAYAELIAEMSAETVWMRGGCESWYRDPENGKLTLLWPGSTMSFRARAGTFSPADYERRAVNDRRAATARDPQPSAGARS